MPLAHRPSRRLPERRPDWWKSGRWNKPTSWTKKPGWAAPFDIQSASQRHVKLARRIAERGRDAAIGARPPAGDVLILVRQRGALFEAIIRALKNAASRSPAPTGWC